MSIRDLIVACGVLVLPHVAFAQSDAVTCNGSDVTSRLNADAAIPNETITLSAGTCNVSNAVIVEAANVTFNGQVSSAGTPTTWVMLTANWATANAIFQVGTSVTDAHLNAAFNNVAVDCGAIPTDYYSGSDDGFQVFAGSNFAILNNVVAQHCMDGIRIDASNAIIENSRSQYNNLNGIFVQGISSTYADSDTVETSHVLFNNQEVGQVGVTGVTWDGIDFGNWTSNITIRGNIVYGPDILYHCDQSASPNSGGIIVGNSVVGSYKFGISVSGCTNNVTVIGNIMTQPVQYSVVVNGSPANGYPQGVTVGNNYSSGGANFFFSGAAGVTAYNNLQY